MPSKLLPTMDLQRACEVNLDAAAIEWVARHGAGNENRLLQPAVTQQMLDELHTKLGVSWSYGSYLEDRSTLLRGSYLDDSGGHIHLGVDVNVPPGTPIAAPCDATVANIFDDGDEQQGWGPRLILRPCDESAPYIVLGHLTPLRFKVGEPVLTGQILAEVAPPPFNGYWFPHLHVQLLARGAVPRHEADAYRSLDGYGHSRDLETLKQDYPDPIHLVLAA